MDFAEVTLPENILSGSPVDLFKALLSTGKLNGGPLFMSVDLKLLDQVFVDKYGEIFGWHLKDSHRSLMTDVVNNPKFEFSYFDRMTKYFGINQLEHVLDSLRRKDFRKNMIVTWDPKIDLGSNSLIPCLTALSFNVSDSALNMGVLFRSRDVVRRLIPNWSALKYMQTRISESEGFRCGTLADFSFQWFYRQEDYEKIRPIL